MKTDLEWVIPRLDKESYVIDVGANTGDHTMIFADIAKEVVAFEPNPRFSKASFEKLHGPYPNVRWIPKAASSTRGITPFYVSDSDDHSFINSSSIFPPASCLSEFYPAMRFHQTGAETTTIDEEIDWPYVTLIWMDVQGAEMEVLKGASRTLLKTDALCIESHDGQYLGAPDMKDICAALSKFGFYSIELASDRRVFIKR